MTIGKGADPGVVWVKFALEKSVGLTRNLR